MQSFRLDSQIALVTSASSGLGAAIAVALAEAGADVAVHDTSSCPERPAPACGRRAGAPCRSPATSSDAVRTGAARGRRARRVRPPRHPREPRARAARRRCPATRHRVGRAHRGPAVEHVPPVPRLRRATSSTRSSPGASSTSSTPRDRREGPGQAASNGGIAHFTRALAREWARHGIAVNAIAPGYVRTSDAHAGGAGSMPAERRRDALPDRVLGRARRRGRRRGVSRVARRALRERPRARRGRRVGSAGVTLTLRARRPSAAGASCRSAR